MDLICYIFNCSKVNAIHAAIDDPIGRNENAYESQSFDPLRQPITKKLEGVVPLMTDPPLTNFATLWKEKK